MARTGAAAKTLEGYPLNQQMIVWIVAAVFLVPGYIISGVLLFGRGSSLVMGLTSLPAEEQARLDKKAMCRFIGVVFIVFMLLLTTALVLSIYLRGWVFWIFIILACAELTAGVVYMNNSGRFKKG